MTSGSTFVDMNNLYDNDPEAVMLKNYIDKSNAELDRASKCVSYFMLLCLIIICCLCVFLFMKYT